MHRIVVSKSSPSCDPARIAELVQSQDSEALDRIARCYFSYLMRVGRCACRDPASAPDAVQDALVSAAERAEQFRGDGSVKAWLSRMVVNACRCRERGRKNDPSWNRPLADTHTSARSGPEDSAALAELSSHLERAISSLKPDDRELFVLSQIDGASAPDLARAFDLSPDAVRARLTRIRRRLRVELGPVWREWSGVAG